jgi:hypothetical protein
LFNLTSISPFQLIIIGVFFTFLISDDRDAGELNVIGNLIVAVGSLILTIAAQQEFIKNQADKNDTKEEIKKQIKDLQEKCEKLDRYRYAKP